MSGDAYRVEPRGEGCAKCGRGELFDIIGPDEVAESISYGDRDEADDICEMLNGAYQKGVAAGQGVV